MRKNTKKQKLFPQKNKKDKKQNKQKIPIAKNFQKTKGNIKTPPTKQKSTKTYVKKFSKEKNYKPHPRQQTNTKTKHKNNKTIKNIKQHKNPQKQKTKNEKQKTKNKTINNK